MRRDAAGTAFEELAHDQDVACGLLAEDLAQHRVHGRLFQRSRRVSAARCSAAVGAGGGAGTAAAGKAGPSRPDRASARAMIAAMSMPVSAPPSISSISCGMAATASRTIDTMSGERSSVWLITRFSSDSTLQENSPMRCAPTMRPLPFSVWNARRRSRRASASCGFCSHCGNSTASRAAFSRASSTNNCRNSGSAPVTRPARQRRPGHDDRCGHLVRRGRRSHLLIRGLCLAQRNHARQRRLHLGQARFGGVEHLPLVGTAGLQRLHVVLDGDHRIRQSLEAGRTQ